MQPSPSDRGSPCRTHLRARSRWLSTEQRLHPRRLQTLTRRLCIDEVFHLGRRTLQHLWGGIASSEVRDERPVCHNASTRSARDSREAFEAWRARSQQFRRYRRVVRAVLLECGFYRPVRSGCGVNSSTSLDSLVRLHSLLGPLARCLASCDIAANAKQIRLVLGVVLKGERFDVQLHPRRDQFRQRRASWAIKFRRCARDK